MLLGIHVTTVVMSLILFNLRVYGYVSRAGWQNSRALKIIPHINDSILLFSAIGMCFQIQQYPFVNAWLGVKVIFLLLYIMFGMLFMRRARKHISVWWLYFLSLACYAFIISVAITHNAWGWFSLLS